MDYKAFATENARAEFFNRRTTLIATIEKELAFRELAQPHLSGIPAMQNASAIERCCDQLTDLQIQQHEAKSA